MDILEQLNPMQKQAVMHMNGPLLILAGAGSGKTKALTSRIAYMIEKGVRPWNILAITFTNKAAKEMRERVNHIIDEGADDVWVATFHSTCVRILRREITRLGYESGFSIYDTDDQERVMKDVLKALNINDKMFMPKAVLSEIGREKDELITPMEYKKKAQAQNEFRMLRIADIYEHYQKRLFSGNALDFDDIIMQTVMLFKQCPDVLEKYQERFRYIMVDEYQDTNTAQYSLISLLASKYKNLCVVGDDDQSIYGWRGANIRNILDFEKDFNDAMVIKLEQNYRSTQTILSAANDVIRNNISRKDKTLWTENESGTNIFIYSAQDEYDEARFVCDQIKAHVAEGGSYKECAVLYRTNAQSRVLEDSLVRGNVPYKLFGGVRFYERREIKDILSYLRVITNNRDSVALKRIINVPKRGIGDTTVDRISVFAQQNDISFFDALERVNEIESISSKPKKLTDFIAMIKAFINEAESVSVAELITSIINRTSYVELLKQEGTDEAQARIDNIDEFINKAYEFENQSENGGLAEFLEEVALVADIDNYSENDDAAVLMTLHSSKGLEFPNVFITGVEEGVFPSYRAITSPDLKAIEEERRLCYVGITRARNRLNICYAHSRMHRGITEYASPSRFIKEIPKIYIDRTAETGKNSSFDAPVKKNIDPPKSSVVSGFGRNRRIEAPGTTYKREIALEMPAPRNLEVDFAVGDRVKHPKYGECTVEQIKPAGADYEVAVVFEDGSVKKFMAHLAKIRKV